MADQKSDNFKRALAETMAWCSARSLGISAADLVAMQNRSEEYEALRPNRNQQESREKAAALLKRLFESPEPLEYRLRSETLKPSSPLDDFCSIEPWERAVAEVVGKRSELMKLTSVREASVQLGKGRILLYNPCENVADGASRAGSSGFFDVDDVPPWDLWVDFSGETLFSWVPEAFIGVAQAGIDANPVQCIRWED